MSEFRKESDERTVRRFEAFSDIVIGFSLAQLGVSLVIPTRVIDLFLNPVWLFSFFWTFSVICALWWFHHRIFASIFMPRTLPVLLNFLWLAVLVLCVFAMQISIRLAYDPASWRFSFFLFACAYGLLAAQYHVGLRELAARLTQEARTALRRQASIMTVWTAAFAVATACVTFIPWGQATGYAIWATMFAAIVGTVLLGRRHRALMPEHADS
jgi:uncharacterized membrane protein